MFPKMKKGITLRWILNGFGVVLLLVLLLEFLIIFALRMDAYRSVEDALFSRADALRGQILRMAESGSFDMTSSSRPLAEDFTDKQKMELQMVKNDGTVLYSSTGFLPEQTQIGDSRDYQEAVNSAGGYGANRSRSASGEHILSLCTAAYSGVYSCASTAGKKCCAIAEPFDAAAAQPFEGGVPEAYIVVADSPAQQAHAAAEERIRRSMERLLADTVKGFSEKKRQAGRLEISGAKTRLALFPVWIISTKYKTKTYRFVMNAHTGRAYGEIPFSKAKMAGIFAAVTAGVALIGTTLTLLL